MDIARSEAKSDLTEADIEVEWPAGGTVSRLRDRAVDLVSRHPRASLVGAFAVGFLLARLVRYASREWA